MRFMPAASADALLAGLQACGVDAAGSGSWWGWRPGIRSVRAVAKFRLGDYLAGSHQAGSAPRIACVSGHARSVWPLRAARLPGGQCPDRAGGAYRLWRITFPLRRKASNLNSDSTNPRRYATHHQFSDNR